MIESCIQLSPAYIDIVTRCKTSLFTRIVRANTSRADLYFPYCSALLYRKYFGTSTHTNCQEIQHEAQREYGLLPYHLHESWNLFMYVDTKPDGSGRSIVRNQARPDDYIEFYALRDVLAAPNVCGDDLGKSSNHFLRPLKAVVLEGTPADAAHASDALGVGRASAAADHSYDFPADPPIVDESYTPNFPYLPTGQTHLNVELSAEEHEKLRTVWNQELYPNDEGAALRDITMRRVYLTMTSQDPKLLKPIVDCQQHFCLST
ncbi:hypothetical protein LQW54_007388 [Pestalotiopsis sp. IQ-011]